MRDMRRNLGRICGSMTLLAAAALGGAQGVSAQGAGGGPYVAMGVGFAQGGATQSTLWGTNNPTRCDRLLYPNPADAPRDAGCLQGSELDGLYGFEPEPGLTGSFAVGYGFGALSVEVEAVQRHQIIHNTLFTVGDLAGSAITGKDTEWSPARPPWADISEFRGRQFFANVYYSLPNPSRLTPYVGIGGGLSQVDFRYYLGFNRKSIAEGYLEAFGGSRDDPGASPDWQRAAGGHGERTGDGRIRAGTWRAGARRRGLRLLAADVARSQGSLGAGSGCEPGRSVDDDAQSRPGTRGRRDAVHHDQQLFRSGVLVRHGHPQVLPLAGS